MALIANNICFGCDHFCLNNEDGLFCGCRAFPDGIPRKYDIGLPHSHDVVIDGQVGDFVYTPAKAEFNVAGRRIRIRQ